MSIFFIEIFTIFLPIYEVLKTHNLREETINAIQSWEEKNKTTDSHASSLSIQDTLSSTKPSRSIQWAARSIRSKNSTASSTDSRRSEMYTMAALENSLRLNAEPLLEFAALRDFSGENVCFVTHVAQWKQEWSIGASKADDRDLRQRQFMRAVRIYAAFVSIDFSEFPINLSSRTSKHLEDVFEASAVALNRNRSVASSYSHAITPFEFAEPPSPTSFEAKSRNSSLKKLHSYERSQELTVLGAANLRSVSRLNHLSAKQEEDKPLPADFVLPIAALDLFDKNVFDAAEKEIKHLILTNTWPKFVNAGFAEKQEERRNLSVLDWVKAYFTRMQTV